MFTQWYTGNPYGYCPEIDSCNQLIRAIQIDNQRVAFADISRTIYGIINSQWTLVEIMDHDTIQQFTNTHYNRGEYRLIHDELELATIRYLRNPDSSPNPLDTGESSQSSDDMPRESDSATVSEDTGEFPAWKFREVMRFQNDEYKRVPWAGEDWFINNKYFIEHYAHVSVKDSKKLAFTESPDKGKRDIQTPIKPGKYLNRFFSDILDESDIRKWAAKFREENDGLDSDSIKFATTADEIENTYVNGPSDSCMRYPANQFSSPYHPSRVYAAGDLRVAYIERDGRITARALVYGEIHSRVYGDIDRLTSLLESAGFERGSMSGAKIQRDIHNGRFVAPYIDSVDSCNNSARAAGVLDCGDYLEISDDSYDFICSDTVGLTSDSIGEYCPHCGNSGHDYDYMHYIEDRDETWCQDCYESNAIYCDECNSDFSLDGIAITTHDGHTVCNSCYEMGNFASCEDCDEYFAIDDMHLNNDGEMICHNCLSQNHFQCYECDSYYRNGDKAGEDLDGNIICDSCAAGLDKTPCDKLADSEKDCDCAICIKYWHFHDFKQFWHAIKPLQSIASISDMIRQNINREIRIIT